MDRYRIDCQDHYDLEKTEDGWLVMYDDVADAIAAAVAAEREACAALAEEHLYQGPDFGELAREIRKRSNG